MNNRKIAIVFYLCAVVFYILAFIDLISNGSMGIILLCFGSMWLCLGSVYYRKSQHDDDDPGSDDPDNDDK